IALLGFTDTALLDTAVTAVAERDAAALYSAVEHVLATGHEPRRFVEDLLERMRDLIVLAAVPERGADLLPQVPADELESMRGQAAEGPGRRAREHARPGRAVRPGGPLAVRRPGARDPVDDERRHLAPPASRAARRAPGAARRACRPGRGGGPRPGR